MNNKILVLYGSETGTAQDFAESIWRKAKRLGFAGFVMAMDDYDISQLIFEPLIIFVCSTTGQGDPPHNMRKFWRFLLRKGLPRDSLINSHIAVLGLGDSSYPKFNFAAKRLNRRLLSLGATQLLEPGLCDDQHDLGPDAVFVPWVQQLTAQLASIYPFIQDKSHHEEDSLILRWRATPTSKLPDEIIFHPGEPRERVFCTVSDNVRVTPDHHFQEVRLITFSAANEEIKYEPGATAYIRPENRPAVVDQLMSLVDRLEPVFQLQAEHLPLPPALQGKVLSLRDVATRYWDLTAVPRRHVFEVLAHTTTSELEKEKLEEFLSAGGLDELYSYCHRPRRTTLEVLADFPHATAGLQIEHLFEIFQPISSRAYSIASSIEYDGPVVKLLVAVVKYRTRLSTPRLGLASNWLASLSGQVCLAIKPTTLVFETVAPVVLVGPGTGVAPFRSFLSQRIAQTHAEGGDVHRQRRILVFGSRYEKCDFHFGKELSKWHSSGELYLITAFSRDQPDKIYVQHRICEEGEKIFQSIFHEKGSIYVAGSSKDMPAAVKDAFVKVLTDHGLLSLQQAQSYIDQMEATARYQQETWS